jgi:hypothetical protein
VTGVRDGKPAFARVFERRRGILEPYGRRMHVVADAEGGYGVDMAPECRMGRCEARGARMAYRKAMWADPKTARGGASNSE